MPSVGLVVTGLRARYEFDRRGPRLRGKHAVEDVPGVAPVFGPIRSVDFVVDVVVGVCERDVFLDAAGLDPTFVPFLRAAKPGAGGPFNGSEVNAVAVADRPDGHRLSSRSVAPE